eukprot:1194463-Prorocentrum_minimum.AAC.4
MVCRMITGYQQQWWGPFRAAQGEFRAAQGEFRAAQGEFRAAQGEFRAAQGELRAAQGELRAAQGELRAAQGEFRAAQGHMAKRVLGVRWGEGVSRPVVVLDVLRAALVVVVLLLLPARRALLQRLRAALALRPRALRHLYDRVSSSACSGMHLVYSSRYWMRLLEWNRLRHFTEALYRLVECLNRFHSSRRIQYPTTNEKETDKDKSRITRESHATSTPDAFHCTHY